MTLFERVEAPRPVGAGIVLQPTGQAVLGALGLRDGVVITALGWVRDFGMGTAQRLPFFNRLMTASMCGTMTGLVSRLALPSPSSQPTG